ncbi:hypothetical protein V495_05813 [Pseudogymnoascus sp. VKM F-4514 (FW-929)]|nr:hypothetical protein V495_05813 [Pseudogymnoascus sp. VKM F-4514 (FW-929)]KFY65453.1 hypothetical protein V497_01387 [Pseudogymnoascus sp. VKM F-4516 (FW-969)]
MDPLSVAASIIAVVQLTSVVIGCLNSLKDTSKDRLQCVIELTNIRNLLVQLTYRLDEASSDDVWHSEVRALATTNGPFDQYRSALEQLQSKLTSSSSSRTKIGGALSWKFSKEEVTNILTRIERLKSLTQIALGMDHFKLSQEIKNDTAAITSRVESIQESQVSKQFRAITDWLSSTDFPAQQSDFIARRQEGTGDWFIISPEFTNWLNGTKQSLFCPGIPGAGKTMITAIAVDHIWKTFQGDNVGVAYVFCNYKRQEKQTASDLLAAILKQLVQGHPSYGAPVTALHKKHADRETRPLLDEVCTALHSVINSYSKSYIIIDALDECTDSDGTRSELISALRNLQTRTDTRLMVTSRFIARIEELFEESPMLEIRANEADVRRYVAGQLCRLPKCVQRDPELQAEIQQGIILAVDGMFLLAYLHVESLRGKMTKKAIRSTLKNLAKGSAEVDQAYNEATRRIESQLPDESKLAKNVLSWITYSMRHLTVKELSHAFAVEAGESELDEDNIPDVEDIISVCAGLVTVDEESNVIRLVHYTTQEYFERVREVWNPKAQEEIASTCLTYLSFETFNTGHCDNDADFESRIEQNPFLNYAARYWGHHALTVQQEITELALPFLRSTNQLLCSTQVIFASDNLRGYGGFIHMGYSQKVEKCLTGIHVTAYFGVKYLLQELMYSDENKNCLHIDARDSKGRTPLSWAAMKGHTATVEWLVEQDNVVADSKDNDNQTPLSHAADGGHEATVKLLVGRHDVAADSKDEIGETPLSHAARRGHEAIVKLLVQRDDVVADSKNIISQTPLSNAAEEGQEAIVRLLVGRHDVTADSKDISSQTPLSHAAQRGHEAIVKLLVKRDDVVADLKDYFGQTPLSWAAKNGREAIVKLLVERDDVVADSKDNNGRTPLSWAAREGYDAIVKLLLERNDVDPNLEDNGGCNPLWAALSGDWIDKSRPEAIVKLLLKRGVIPDSKNKDGRTPLSIAAEKGLKEIVELLLETGDVDPNSKDNNGYTPLWVAVQNKHEEIVELFLKRDDADPNSKDDSGYSLLWIAAEFGYKEIMRLLLKRGDINPNSRDTSGRTPLWLAVRKGHEEIIKLLLERDDVDPNSRDEYGYTPLQISVEAGHKEIVGLLLERSDINPNSENSYGYTPLFFAVDLGHAEIVGLLLERGDIDLNATHINGSTLLSLAVGRRDEEIVKLLLKRDDVDPNSEDRYGHTPLWRATSRGRWHESLASYVFFVEGGRGNDDGDDDADDNEDSNGNNEVDDSGDDEEDDDMYTSIYSWDVEGGDESDNIGDDDGDNDGDSNRDNDGDNDGDNDRDNDGDNDRDDDGDNDGDNESGPTRVSVETDNSNTQYKSVNNRREKLEIKRQAIVKLLADRIAKDKEAQTGEERAAEEGEAETGDTTGKEIKAQTGDTTAKEIEIQMEKQTVQEGEA